jgi:hypothetical protein
MGVRGGTGSTLIASLLKKGAVGGSGRRISTPVKEQRSFTFLSAQHEVYARFLFLPELFPGTSAIFPTNNYDAVKKQPLF